MVFYLSVRSRCSKRLTLENYAGFFPPINLKLSFQPAVQFIDCILKRLLMALFEAIKR